CFLDRGVQELISARCAQWSTQVRCILLTQAHVQRAGAGDAHTIARFAEIVCERRDEAEPTTGLGHADVASWSTGAILDISKGEPLPETRTYDRERKVLIKADFSDIPERHYLDQGKIHAAPVCPFDEGREFVLVDAFERHGIDFHLEPGSKR